MASQRNTHLFVCLSVPEYDRHLASIHPVYNDALAGGSPPSVSKDPGAVGTESPKACMLCRARQIHCNGAQPACVQCIKANLTDACRCELEDSQAQNRERMLQDRIGMLEAQMKRMVEGGLSDG